MRCERQRPLTQHTVYIHHAADLQPSVHCKTAMAVQPCQLSLLCNRAPLPHLHTCTAIHTHTQLPSTTLRSCIHLYCTDRLPQAQLRKKKAVLPWPIDCKGPPDSLANAVKDTVHCANAVPQTQALAQRVPVTVQSRGAWVVKLRASIGKTLPNQQVINHLA